MSVEANKRILRRFFEELFNTGDLSIADEIVADNYVNHNNIPGEPPGRDGLKAFVTLLRTSFPDIHFTVDDQIAEGGKVVTRLHFTGTHQGEFMGVPPTGKTINVTAINIQCVSGGQIQETWLDWDALGSLHQLGAIAAPQQVEQ
ncbi:MAG: hypothetical protein FOGNACKC_06378 [Anaerolineae bacterium]|nr:hypothetical protein [Anaerolineae bacterium]